MVFRIATPLLFIVVSSGSARADHSVFPSDVRALAREGFKKCPSLPLQLTGERAFNRENVTVYEAHFKTGQSFTVLRALDGTLQIESLRCQ